jgi:hypothetical protein
MQDGECDSNILGMEKQLDAIAREINKKKEEKENIKGRVHEIGMEYTRYQIEKANQDDIPVGCMLEVGTIDYFRVTPRAKRPWGAHNDVGQLVWAPSFGKFNRSDCLEETRDAMKASLLAFYNMGETTSQSFLDLYRQPKICSIEDWAVQMGTRCTKLSLCR